MKKSGLTVFILMSLFLSGCNTPVNPDLKPLETVDNIDVKRYMGKWYEIAAIPVSFQKDCVATTATYTLQENGDVKVLNECREKSLDGKYKKAEAKAWVVDKDTNAKLKVSFFWPFAGDYWVIELAEDYSYAVVGHPSREYGWILSRTPQIDDKLYQEILNRMKAKDYDLSKIKKTLQVKE